MDHLNGEEDNSEETAEAEALVDVLHCILDSIEGIEAKLEVIMSQVVKEK